MYKLVERNDHFAVHGLFHSEARADNHLVNVLPVYIAKGYLMDKTLTANDFEIIKGK